MTQGLDTCESGEQKQLGFVTASRREMKDAGGRKRNHFIQVRHWGARAQVRPQSLLPSSSPLEWTAGLGLLPEPNRTY